MLNKEMVLNILGADFTPNVNIGYYLRDFRGEAVDLKTCKNVVLYSDNQFSLNVNEGIITLETTASNQLIDTEFMNKLMKLNEKKVVFQTLINL